MISYGERYLVYYCVQGHLFSKVANISAGLRVGTQVAKSATLIIVYEYQELNRSIFCNHMSDNVISLPMIQRDAFTCSTDDRNVTFIDFAKTICVCNFNCIHINP